MNSIRILVLGLSLWCGIVESIAHATEPKTSEPAKVGPVHQSTLPEPTEKLLVLRSGGVWRGAVRLEGEHYRIVTNTSEIRLRAVDVDFICNNLEEAYRIKASHLPTGQALGHLKLCAWCIHMELFDKAALELLNAKRIDPKLRDLELIERRLQVAIQTSRQRELAKKTQATVALQTNSESKRSIAMEEPLAGNDSMPIEKESLEQFSQQIQPILLHSCTTSGCHSGHSNDGMILDRTALIRGNHRRITERNLQMVLRFISKDDPSESKLLKMAFTAHGPVEHGIMIGRKEPLYQKLSDWVDSVANPKPEIAMAPEPTNPIQDPFVTPADFENLSDEALDSLLEDEPETNAEPAAMDEKVRPLPTGFKDPRLEAMKLKAPTRLLEGKPQIQYGSGGATWDPKAAIWEPKDAFDAAIFNRQLQKKE